MNEEGFDICAKMPNNEKGLCALKPRAAYYAFRRTA